MLETLRVAVDVGGTFTDICIMDETTGLIRIEKTASSPDPIDGIMSGIGRAAIDLAQRRAVLARHDGGHQCADHAASAAHRHGLHQGFRDVIEIRRANKEELWDTYKDVVKPYVPRRDRLVVSRARRRAGRCRHAAR